MLEHLAWAAVGFVVGNATLLLGLGCLMSWADWQAGEARRRRDRLAREGWVRWEKSQSEKVEVN